MMKNSKKMPEKYIKALSNQVMVRGQGQIRLGLCSKLYREGENILVPYCQMNTVVRFKTKDEPKYQERKSQINYMNTKKVKIIKENMMNRSIVSMI